MARSTKIKSKLIAEDSVEFSQLTPGTVPVLDENKNIISSVVTPSELANLSGTTAPLQDQINTENEKIDDHIADTANPHQVTKTQVGLSEVDNTSDLNKPISTATQDALDLKYDASNPSNFVDAIGAAAAAPVQSVAGKVGEVELDKSDVGLSNVDNTSDVNKPISTATQDALDLKQDSLGFTPENVANKTTDSSFAEDSDTLYPTQKAVKTFVQNSISSASVPDATTEIKGKIKLAGDLGGTADAPTVPELANKEPTITAGTTSQYFRGDKTFQELDKTAVGLGNVDNTSDLDKPISTATQDALDLKQDSLGFTPEDIANKSTDGTLSSNSDALYPSQKAVKTYVDNSISSASVPDATAEIKGKLKLAGDLSGTADAPTVPGLANKIDSSREGQPNGIATLDGVGKVPATQLPSYVDDVIEYADLLIFPLIGETGKIYVALDTNKIYRWSGSTYIEISPSPAPVWGSITGTLSSQTDLQSALNGKANTSHTQDLSTINQSGATTGQVPIWNGTAWTPGVPAGTATWGNISGMLSNQTDLQSTLDGKFDDPTGTIAQYIRGDGSLATFPTSINQANSLVTTVFNKSGAPIPKFSVVYINGGQGDMPTIALAQANGESSSSKTYGVVYADIPNMSSGQVIVNGALTGINTDQFNPTAPIGDVNGTALYLSPTIPGGVTTTKPIAPDHMVYVATIVRTHQNEGVVEVRIQNGFELQELHNVQILNGSEKNNQILKYDSATSLWKNKYIGSEGDIEETLFSLTNNQSLATDVTNFAFLNSKVRGFTALVTVEIDATSDTFEQFTLNGIQKNGSWNMSSESIGDNTGIVFSITSSGQIQYVSQNYTGFVSGKIKFRAITTSF